MKRLLLLPLLFFTLLLRAQFDEETRIENQFIVMLKPGSDVKGFLVAFPSLQVKQCLSRRMNIWLLERNSTSDADNFLVGMRRSGLVKLAQFNHHIQQRS